MSTIREADTGKQADTIITNGRIATEDERRSFASAVAIKDGRFLAVGTEKEVMAHRGNETVVIDIRGRTVIPGLINSHMHPIRGGLNYNMELRWDGVPSLADALRIRVIRAFVSCLSLTRTSLRRGKGSARIRTATWRFSPTWSKARSNTAIPRAGAA